jgi:uncharacterized protein (TIGR01777 family)
MRVLVSGSTGFIGTGVVAALELAGHEVFRLVRPPVEAEYGEILWDPLKGYIDVCSIDECDAIIHLAGENVAGRWTKAKKERIYESRIRTTELLYDFVEQLKVRPGVFIAASGISYCGDRGDEISTETTGKGIGFLCDVTQQREAAARSISDLGPRVVMTRFAMVFSGKGGGLKKLLGAFEAGLGGVMGNGRQYWPWVSLDDAVRAVMFALENSSLEGPVNVVSPETVTNAEFTKTLGHVLDKPTFCKKPASLLRMLLGQFADELLLTSNRAMPVKLLKAGFEFQDASLEGALGKMLKHKAEEMVHA